MYAKRVTGVDLRSTIQRWSNNAAAGADSWKRCDWKQFTDTMYNQIAEYLNTIVERAGEMNYKELIETPIWPEDIRTTQVANIKKEAESPGPRVVRLLRMVEHAIQRNDDVGKAGMAPQNCARRNPRRRSMKKKMESQQQQLTRSNTSTAYVGRSLSKCSIEWDWTSESGSRC